MKLFKSAQNFKDKVEGIKDITTKDVADKIMGQKIKGHVDKVIDYKDKIEGIKDITTKDVANKIMGQKIKEQIDKVKDFKDKIEGIKDITAKDVANKIMGNKIKGHVDKVKEYKDKIVGIKDITTKDVIGKLQGKKVKRHVEKVESGIVVKSAVYKCKCCELKHRFLFREDIKIAPEIPDKGTVINSHELLSETCPYYTQYLSQGKDPKHIRNSGVYIDWKYHQFLISHDQYYRKDVIVKPEQLKKSTENGISYLI